MNVCVLDSLRGGLTILTGRTFKSLGNQTFSSSFRDVYVLTPVFLICVQSMSGWSPRGMNTDLGWGCLIQVLSDLINLVKKQLSPGEENQWNRTGLDFFYISVGRR